MKWVAISFSRGSSWPRNWTLISCLEVDSLPLSHLGSLKLWHNITTRILIEIQSTDLFQISSILLILLCVYLDLHSFIRCVGLCLHHTHSQDIEVTQPKALIAFITTYMSFCPNPPCIPSLTPGDHHSVHFPVSSSFQECHMNRIIRFITIIIFLHLAWFSVSSSKLLHVSITHTFLLMSSPCFWCTNVFNHLPTDSYLVLFPVFLSWKKPVINSHVQIFVWKWIFTSLG